MIWTYKKFRKERVLIVLGGIFSFYRYKNLYWCVKFFWITLFCWSVLNYKNTKETTFSIFPVKDFKKYVRELLFEELVSQVEAQIENIIFLRCGIGETYIFSTILEAYMSKKNINLSDTCFGGSSILFRDVLLMKQQSLIYRQFPLPRDLFLFSCEKEHYRYRGKDIYFVLSKDFAYKLCEDLKSNVKRNNIFTEICNLYGIDKTKIQSTQVYLPDGTNDRAISKIKKYNLNLDKFVYLMPDANSSLCLSTKFWKKLEAQLRSLGYDVFYNTKALDLFESFYIAANSKAIIGLTSGFLDMMLQTGVPIYCIFTKLLLHNVPAKKNAEIYAKKLFPNVKSTVIQEYIADEYSEDELCKRIIEDFITKMEVLDYENSLPDSCTV